MQIRQDELKLKFSQSPQLLSPMKQKQSTLQNIKSDFDVILCKNKTLLSQDQKWSECKILGNNIQSRSRSSANIYNDSLYVYGGYELSCGILSDFWQIQMKSQNYIWQKVKCKSQENPGKRKNHTSVVYKDKLFLFGGQHQILQNNSSLWAYDFQQRKWSQKLEQALECGIDGHNSILIDNKIYIFFGYLSGQGQYSNAVYSINLDNFQTEQIYELDIDNLRNSPKGRIETSICKVENRIYFFGGYTGLARLNDLWYFDLEKRLYSQINPQSAIMPMTRSGHQLVNLENNNLILFGGIHTITWELDDLYIFDIKSNTWIQVDQDSARSKECSPLIKLNSDSDIDEKSKSPSKKSKNQKKYNTFVCLSPTKQRSPKKRQSNLNGVETLNHIEDVNVDLFQYSGVHNPPLSPNKSVTEQKRKEFNLRKQKMLKNFEIPPDKLSLYKDLSPTSEAMKNALNAIGNPSKNTTSVIKSKVCKFNEPLKDQSKQINGKKPCARDGHRCDFYGKDKIVVFGGDRHKMSFNDIHILDLKQLNLQIKEMLKKQ